MSDRPRKVEGGFWQRVVEELSYDIDACRELAKGKQVAIGDHGALMPAQTIRLRKGLDGARERRRELDNWRRHYRSLGVPHVVRYDGHVAEIWKQRRVYTTNDTYLMSKQRRDDDSSRLCK